MVNKSKNKSKKKVVYSDSEELYNSEDDYVSESSVSEPASETASDIESESESDAESGTQSGGEESSEIYNSETEEIDEESDNASSEREDEEEEADDEEADDEVEIEEAEEIEPDGDIGDDDAGGDAYVGESKVCYAKNLDKDFLVLDEDDSHMYGKMEYKKVADADRISDENLTYYEMVRIIGTRAQQFNYGAPPLCKNLDNMHPAKMAYVELKLKMTPYIIRRHLPGKKYEEWRIDELEQIHEITDDFFVPGNIDWNLLVTEANKLNKKTKIIKK